MQLLSSVGALARRLSAAVALAALFTGAASAAVVLSVDTNGNMTGARGVDVGGVLYDVRFVDGTCAAIFSGCDSAAAQFTFTTESQARAAASALLDQVFIDVHDWRFDSEPDRTLGCVGADRLCFSVTPFEANEVQITGAAAINRRQTDEIADSVGVGSIRRVRDTTDENAVVWAVWSAPSAVPEPSTVALLGFASVALVWSQRRRRLRGNVCDK